MDADDRAEGADPLFACLWDALVDVLGSAASAALVRRAQKRAMAHQPTIGGLEIRRDGFEYAYVVPERWRVDVPGGLTDLRTLARELSPLLVELTGPVVVRRLNRMERLSNQGIHFEERQS